MFGLLLSPMIASTAMTSTSVSEIGNALRLRRVELVHLYTGAVVRVCSFAFVLALLVTAKPVLGVVCEMDCDQPPTTSSECHQSTGSPGGSTVRGGQHGCDHDHTAGSPALLANASVRDAVVNFVAIPVQTLAHVSVTDARVALFAMHGPPGLSGRSTSSHNTALRI